MKKLFILLSILLVVKNSKSQNVNSCIGSAQNICGNPNFLFQGISGSGLVSGLNISNPNTNPQIGNGSNPTAAANAGCLMTAGPGPQWLLLTVSNSGNLGFSFGAAGSANPQVGLYDWEMWLFTPTTCANIFNNTLPPVSCNWNGSSTGGTGMGPVPTGGSASNFQPSIPVTVGQQYLILISNYSGVTTPVSFTSTGTAGLSCGFNTEICIGNSATVTPVGFIPLTNQTYTLMPGGIANTTGSFVLTPTVTTIYTVTGSGLNSQNQPAIQTSTTSITVHAQPFSAPTTTQTTCTSTVNGLNLGLSFVPGGPVPTYTITWAPNTPFGIASPTQVSTSGGIAPANYTAIITAQGGCTATAVVPINPPPAPAVFGLLPVGPVYSVTCIQDTVVIDGSQQTYGYAWNNGVTAPMTGLTTSFTAFSLGNWTVTATNPVSGCISKQTFTVVLNNSPPLSSVSPINQSVTCGPGVVATATGVAISPTINVSHFWYAPGIPAPYVSGGQTSIYYPIVGTSTYVLVNLINGCSTSKTIQVVSTAGNYPTFSTSSPVANYTMGCAPRNITDINIISGNTVPSGGVISYTLLPPSFTGTNYITAVGASVYSVTIPGTYTVIVKDNGNACETRLLLSIIQNTFGPEILTSVETQTLTCFTPSVTLRGNSGTPNVSYTWKKSSLPPLITNSIYPVNTTSAGASVPSATVIDNYTLTVLDMGNACISTSVVTLYQNTRPPKPGIAFSFTALTCSTYSVNATNNSTTGVLPGTFFGTANLNAILWQGPSPQTDLANSSTYLAFTPGSYSMTVMDMNNGCTSSTTAILGDNRVYPVIVTNTNIALDCGAGSGGVKLAAQAQNLATNAVTAQWFIPNDPTINTSATNNLTLTTDGVGDYKLVVTTNSNACTGVAVVHVVNGSLTANFSADHVTGYAPLTVNFTNNSSSTSTTTGTSSITSVWSFGNGTTKTTTVNTTAAATSAVYTQPGTYTVTMFTNKGSCVDTFVKVIKVDIPSKLEIPNVFTPNGDNSNDIFFIKAANLTDITALIYDRWGNKIYELTTDKGNIAWDGKSNNGKDAPDGTYFYIITATGKDGQTYDTKGTVSLFR